MWVESWDYEQRDWTRNSGAMHIRVLWRMSREKRGKAWSIIGRWGRVEKLVLSGELGPVPGGVDSSFWCPMDLKELWMLLPEGVDALVDLRELTLMRVRELDNSWLHALATAGCGRSLESLSLCSECHSLFGGKRRS